MDVARNHKFALLTQKLLHGGHAAIYFEGHAGDKLGPFGAEEEGCGSHVFAGTQTAVRDALDQRVIELGVGKAVGVMGVTTKVGAMALTEMPNLAHSQASWEVYILIAPLLAQ